MPYLGRKSWSRLRTTDPRLQAIAQDAIDVMDFTVLEGERDRLRQDELFELGLTQVRWPGSKHNASPSLAMDLAPYPIDWNDLERFAVLAGVIRAVAYSHGVQIRWGGDWDRDDETVDERFRDLCHFEIVEDQ